VVSWLKPKQLIEFSKLAGAGVLMPNWGAELWLQAYATKLSYQKGRDGDNRYSSDKRRSKLHHLAWKLMKKSLVSTLAMGKVSLLRKWTGLVSKFPLLASMGTPPLVN
jgi:hypothetical protein